MHQKNKLLPLRVVGIMVMLLLLVGCNSSPVSTVPSTRTPTVTVEPAMVAPTITPELSTVTSSLSPSNARPGQILGRVYLSGGMKIPFASATVTLMDATLPSADPKSMVAEVTTNESGNFAFREVQPGPYTLLIRGVLDELPPNLTECPSGISFDGWWIYSEITPEGKIDTSATLTAEFSVSNFEVLRFVINFSCG